MLGPNAGRPSPHPRGLGYPSGMKTFTIEIQRIKALTDRHGLVVARVDAAVQPLQPGRGQGDDAEGEPASTLSMTVDNARVLFLLLKKQLAEVDSRKARSQR